MYESKSKSLWRRAAALCAAAVLALTACVQGAYAQERTVIPLGQAVGIKLFANGVLVVDVSALEGVGGKSPAQKCGIREGDLLLTFNGEKIASTEHLQELLRQNGAQPAQLEFQRGQENQTVEITPVCGDDGSVRLGAWIRDSMAGIGTMTYYDPETGAFGALGHGITDADTALLMPFGSGSILPSSVKAVKKGECGSAGELRGDFDLQCDLGTLTANTACGIFGRLEKPESLPRQEALPVGQPETGPAVVRANVEGDSVKEYAIEILKTIPDPADGREMVLCVTDPNLLAVTGGIVQGMSGSPILQNGKLVGAVTHVLLNDPAKGYGISVDTMLKAAE